MPLPVTLAATYLVVNFAIMVWLVREETRGRMPGGWTLAGARLLRYGPALLGFFYLVTIAGDWPFVLFVGAFFAGAFWLLIGFLDEASRQHRKR
ncbi:MAG TPA: hypothetical protein VLA76_07535 [Candidatus Angelobacter sp.]|nr:hypothetical protein [Candidatus Angelobacter sp.]